MQSPVNRTVCMLANRANIHDARVRYPFSWHKNVKVEHAHARYASQAPVLAEDTETDDIDMLQGMPLVRVSPH